MATVSRPIRIAGAILLFTAIVVAAGFYLLSYARALAVSAYVKSINGHWTDIPIDGGMIDSTKRTRIEEAVRGSQDTAEIRAIVENLSKKEELDHCPTGFWSKEGRRMRLVIQDNRLMIRDGEER